MGHSMRQPWGLYRLMCVGLSGLFVAGVGLCRVRGIRVKAVLLALTGGCSSEVGVVLAESLLAHL